MIVLDLLEAAAHAPISFLLACLRTVGRPLVKVVIHKGVIREKPASEEQARAFIRSYADEPATTVGACVCVCLDTSVSYKDVEVNSAEISAIPERSIDALIKEGMVFNCAGGVSSCYIQRINSNVCVVHLCFHSQGSTFLGRLLLVRELGAQTFAADVQLWAVFKACAFGLLQLALACTTSLHIALTLILTSTLTRAPAGLMIEHPLVQEHVKEIHGTIDGIMGLSRSSFMRVLLKTAKGSPDHVA
jgi:hypothetical protein